jgi:hypothetical protein
VLQGDKEYKKMISNDATKNPNNNANQTYTSKPAGTGYDWRAARYAGRAERRTARWADPLRGLWLGLMLILVAVLSLPGVTGGLTGEQLAATWLLGIGGVFIVDGLVRHAQPWPWGGFRLAVGIALAVAGGLVLLGLSEWWPLVLLGLGIITLLRPLFAKI